MKGRLLGRGVTLPCPKCGIQITLTPPHVHPSGEHCAPRCLATYNSLVTRRCPSCRSDIYAAIGEALAKPVVEVP